MSGRFDYFCEGGTDENVLVGLGLVAPSHRDPTRMGKDAINKRMVQLLGPKLGVEAVHALVMRDVDMHVGETDARIRRSVEDRWRAMFKERGFEVAAVKLTPHQTHPNVYTFAAVQPDVRLALHLAVHRHSPEFIKSTIDDYVLSLALRGAAAQRLLQEKQAGDRRKAELNVQPQREWSLDEESLCRKVRDEIPALLQQNGVPPLLEAKVYLHFYTAVLQEPISPAVFAKLVLRYAPPAEVQAVFAALLAAARFLTGAAAG